MAYIESTVSIGRLCKAVAKVLEQRRIVHLDQLACVIVVVAVVPMQPYRVFWCKEWRALASRLQASHAFLHEDCACNSNNATRDTTIVIRGRTRCYAQIRLDRHNFKLRTHPLDTTPQEHEREKRVVQHARAFGSVLDGVFPLLLPFSHDIPIHCPRRVHLAIMTSIVLC